MNDAIREAQLAERESARLHGDTSITSLSFYPWQWQQQLLGILQGMEHLARQDSAREAPSLEAVG